MLAHSTLPVLVVGPCQAEGERADLRAWAYDVCDQMCVSVVVATHDQYDVRDFGAVYVYGRSLADGATTGSYDPYGIVLEAEAWAYGVPVITPQSVRLAASCDACGQYQTINTVRNGHGEVFCRDCEYSGRCAWCAEDTVTDPFPTPDGWAPFCEPCAKATRRVTKAERTSRRRATTAV
ncbi:MULTISPECIES: hypothetical protein [unclassified Streptomyces]|uniref:hypothetical protein n=1 Tax=unclassified Streptomyces TaxID=2593676 RepID=UPI00343882AE